MSQIWGYLTPLVMGLSSLFHHEYVAPLRCMEMQRGGSTGEEELRRLTLRFFLYYIFHSFLDSQSVMSAIEEYTD